MTRHAQQLPRGRHGIPREEVLASQRGRMLVAMTDVVAERGFAQATVADVLRRAGVSRETFYEQFADKEDCFLAALDGASVLLSAELAQADDASEVLEERLAAVLRAYLVAMAEQPAAARTFLIEVYGAGPQALAHRVAMIDGFVALVTGLVGAHDERSRFRCQAFVGAVSSMVTMQIATGDGASLAELHGPLMDLGRDLLLLEGA